MTEATIEAFRRVKDEVMRGRRFTVDSVDLLNEAREERLREQINGSMPHHVVRLVGDALNDAGRPVKGSRIHLLGVAYKRDVDDLRESPALDILALLAERGADLAYSDPHVPAFSHLGRDYRSIPADAASRLVVDTRNALGGFRDPIRRL